MPLAQARAITKSSSIYDIDAAHQHVQQGCHLPASTAMHSLQITCISCSRMQEEIQFMAKKMHLRSLQDLYQAVYPHEAIVHHLAQLSWSEVKIAFTIARKEIM